jgi:hypothetical protein
MTRLNIKFLFIFSLLSIVLSEDCKSPLDCYLNAMSLLNKAREEYRLATDRLEKIIGNLSQDTNNKISQVNGKIDSINNEVNNRISSLDQKINSVNIEITNKAVKQCEFITCKIGNWGSGCRCPGNKKILTGGCFIPDQPYVMQMSQIINPQTWTCSHVGAGGSTVEINLVCCDIPLY